MMMTKPLKIIANDQKASELRIFRPKSNREQSQAQFEDLWQHHPHKFNPFNNSVNRERVLRTLNLIDKICPVKDKKVVDLGCGAGELSRLLKNRGGQITAIDIAKNALDFFREKGAENILLTQDCIPQTKLDDSDFDVVVCAELICHLKPKDHRLFVSELNRITKREGFIVCSTEIDIYSEDALEKFAALLETELVIIDWKLSHHGYYIRILNLFKSPLRFVKAREDKVYREQAIAKRNYLAKQWFKVNSSFIFGSFWSLLKPFFKKFYHWLEQSHFFMKNMEKICRLLSGESGISHVIVAAQKRPIIHG